MTDQEKPQEKPAKETLQKNTSPESSSDQSQEHNGRGGLEPTRYTDWEINGKCVDF